jgi:hypothetical protein
MGKLKEDLLLLKQAANSVLANTSQKPSPTELVGTLLDGEKLAKHNKKRYSFEELRGTWRLCFITGTKKARNRAGIVLGAGRYVPNWVKIQITYTCTENDTGKVENVVQFGSLKLSLTGPVKFLAYKNILAFDFTHITVQLFGIKIYDGYIRGGKNSEETFYQTGVGKQAFFAYFLITDEIIAARGRGGGLALWRRI